MSSLQHSYQVDKSDYSDPVDFNQQVTREHVLAAALEMEASFIKMVNGVYILDLKEMSNLSDNFDGYIKLQRILRRKFNK